MDYRNDHRVIEWWLLFMMVRLSIVVTLGVIDGVRYKLNIIFLTLSSLPFLGSLVRSLVLLNPPKIIRSISQLWIVLSLSWPQSLSGFSWTKSLTLKVHHRSLPQWWQQIFLPCLIHQRHLPRFIIDRIDVAKDPAQGPVVPSLVRPFSLPMSVKGFSRLETRVSTSPTIDLAMDLLQYWDRLSIKAGSGGRLDKLLNWRCWRWRKTWDSWRWRERWW